MKEFEEFDEFEQYLRSSKTVKTPKYRVGDMFCDPFVGNNWRQQPLKVLKVCWSWTGQWMYYRQGGYTLESDTRMVRDYIIL